MKDGESTGEIHVQNDGFLPSNSIRRADVAKYLVESLLENKTGINGISDAVKTWNYEKTENGRLRFEAGDGYYYDGFHAATLDADSYGTESINYLIRALYKHPV